MTQAAKILVVDDVLENRRLIAGVLTEKTEYGVLTASDGTVIFDILEKELPDLILLDIMMPKMDGYEIAQRLQENEATRHIPIIFLTAKTDMESKVHAFQNGGVDYITKPFCHEELLARVDAHMHLKRIQDELKVKNRLLANREVHLKHLVGKKTKRVENISLALVTALEDANLANDDDTGNHIRRVGEYSALLAEAQGASPDYVKRIKLYSPLHDVGKVGVPDAILKKPGKFTPDEHELMKQHVIIGGRMMENPAIDSMASSIALYHHEKWDGSGYCSELTGEWIPLESRIVALADVYDALRSKRVYKPTFSQQETEEIIREERGRHFDPHLVDLFFQKRKKFNEINEDFKG